jgi:thiol-disulfide isomerase/thioredoxin
MLNRWTVVTTAILFGAAAAMAQPVVPPKKKDKQQPSNSSPAKTPTTDQTGNQPAANATLKVGDKAPALSVEEWVKGKKVDKFESGKIYVVEFWATWCQPCKESIPHLNDLQKTYKDKNVTIIGVAGSERGSSTQQKLDGVRNFVKGKGDGMNYTVAFDADRSMTDTWMTPAGRNGIPCAFLVGADGKLAWIGHPAEGLEDQIKKAVDANKNAPVKKTGALDATPRITLASFQPEKDAKKEAAQPAGTALKIGDKAPTLTITDWVQGQPITGFEKGKAYVVEFWATTSRDSWKLIPHLNELQKKYGDKVTIAGISRKDNSGESAQKLADFVKNGPEQVQYTVGFDAERTTVDNWSKAANQRGTPQVFIVTQDGTIGWMGNPLRAIEELDDAVGLAASGKLNAETSKATTDKWMAERQKRIDLAQSMRDAMESGDYKAATQALDKLIESDKFNGPDYAASKFQLQYVRMKDPAAALAYGAELTDGLLKNNAQGLNAIAWTIVDPENAGIEKKDLKLAVKAAERAAELTKHKDAYILDTLAKAYYDSGDKKKAIEMQEKAVELIPPSDQAAGEIKERLEQYKKDSAK